MTKGPLMEVTKNERRMNQLSYWECGCLRRRVRSSSRQILHGRNQQNSGDMELMSVAI